MLNKELITAFGKHIRYLREQKGISQEELSFKTGFHRTYIGMIERGERNISLSNIAVFAKIFEMDISALLDLKSVAPDLNYDVYQSKIELNQNE